MEEQPKIDIDQEIKDALSRKDELFPKSNKENREKLSNAEIEKKELLMEDLINDCTEDNADQTIGQLEEILNKAPELSFATMLKINGFIGTVSDTIKSGEKFTAEELDYLGKKLMGLKNVGKYFGEYMMGQDEK